MEVLCLWVRVMLYPPLIINDITFYHTLLLSLILSFSITYYFLFHHLSVSNFITLFHSLFLPSSLSSYQVVSNWCLRAAWCSLIDIWCSNHASKNSAHEHKYLWDPFPFFNASFVIETGTNTVAITSVTDEPRSAVARILACRPGSHRFNFGSII